MKKCLIFVAGVNPGHVRDGKYIEKILKHYFDVKIVNLMDISSVNFDFYDIIIVNTSLEGIQDNDLLRFFDYMHSVNKTLLFLHEACIYNRKLLCFKEALGVRFSTHKEYEEFEVEVVQDHWLTQNINKTFCISDELYILDDKSYFPKSCDTIFLREKTTHTIVGYERINEISNSRVIYISLGHNEDELQANDSYCMLMKNLRILA